MIKKKNSKLLKILKNITIILIVWILYEALLNNIKSLIAKDKLLKITQAFEKSTYNLRESMHIIYALHKNGTLGGIIKSINKKNHHNEKVFLIERTKRQESEKYPFCNQNVTISYAKRKDIVKNAESTILTTIKFGSQVKVIPYINQAISQLAVDDLGVFVINHKDKDMPIMHEKRSIYQIKLEKIEENDIYNIAPFVVIQKGKSTKYVICDSIIYLDYRIYNIQNKLLLSNKIKMNVGNGYLPYSLEQVLIRARKGDKIKIFLPEFMFKRKELTERDFNSSDKLKDDINIFEFRQQMNEIFSKNNFLVFDLEIKEIIT
jgi:hypothetical protein